MMSVLEGKLWRLISAWRSSVLKGEGLLHDLPEKERTGMISSIAIIRMLAKCANQLEEVIKEEKEYGEWRSSI